MEFLPFDKIARLKREVVVTEKIDGTNSQIAIIPVSEDVDGLDHTPLAQVDVAGTECNMYVGSRNRWLQPESVKKGGDNFGFAGWALAHVDELADLGFGRHYGEWWGLGIQRGYGLKEKRFSLFNTGRWTAETAVSEENGNIGWDYRCKEVPCCHVVPVLAYGEEVEVDDVLQELADRGSFAAPGFMQPEGIVLYHTASRTYFKQTLDGDGGKWRAAP